MKYFIQDFRRTLLNYNLDVKVDMINNVASFKNGKQLRLSYENIMKRDFKSKINHLVKFKDYQQSLNFDIVLGARINEMFNRELQKKDQKFLDNIRKNGYNVNESKIWINAYFPIEYIRYNNCGTPETYALSNREIVFLSNWGLGITRFEIIYDDAYIYDVNCWGLHPNKFIKKTKFCWGNMLLKSYKAGKEILGEKNIQTICKIENCFRAVNADSMHDNSLWIKCIGKLLLDRGVLRPETYNKHVRQYNSDKNKHLLKYIPNRIKNLSE